MMRYAYLNFDLAVNRSAHDWFRNQRHMMLPVDSRTLRDAWTIVWGNVVNQPDRPLSTAKKPQAQSSNETRPDPPGDDDILYISGE
jgi:hypothetical protein